MGDPFYTRKPVLTIYNTFTPENPIYIQQQSSATFFSSLPQLPSSAAFHLLHIILLLLGLVIIYGTASAFCGKNIQAPHNHDGSEKPPITNSRDKNWPCGLDPSKASLQPQQPPASFTIIGALTTSGQRIETPGFLLEVTSVFGW